VSRRAERSGALIVACVLGLGFWQLGEGTYVPAKAWLAQELMLNAWDRATAGAERPAPWPWADTWPVARLLAKGGEVDLVVLAGGSGRTLAFGPGHLSESALPGQRGNAVIAGHRDTHFRFLKDLAVGERLWIEAASGDGYSYEIIDIDVVDSRRSSLVLDSDEPMLTLVTCYPFDAATPGGPMRYIVTARRRL
jgi:sortase A